MVAHRRIGFFFVLSLVASTRLVSAWQDAPTPAADAAPNANVPAEQSLLREPPNPVPYPTTSNSFPAEYFETSPQPTEWLEESGTMGTRGRFWVPRSFTGQLLWMGRSQPADNPVLMSRGLDNGAGVVTHENTVYLSDLVFPAEIGVRTSLLFERVGNWQVELAYLGMFDQGSVLTYEPPSASVTETGNFFFDNTVVNSATYITHAYESDLHSVEGNVWYDDGWRVQALFGPRWIRFSETYEQYETLTTDDGALAELRNDLIGGQVGFRVYIWQLENLSVFAIAKGGVFYNRTNMSASVDNGGVVLGTISASSNVTSSAGEFNLTANWQPTPFFNLHVGYTGLYLSQVAQIGDQFDNFSFLGGTTAFDYSGVIYHGGHFGVTLAW